MFVIDLRRADGTVLPYKLTLEPEDAKWVRLRVSDDECVYGEAIVPYGRIPLTQNEGDLRSRSMSFGFEPCFGWLVIEFGDESRLGLVSAAEVRSALGVCRMYGNAMVTLE